MVLIAHVECRGQHLDLAVPPMRSADRAPNLPLSLLTGDVAELRQDLVVRDVGREASAAVAVTPDHEADVQISHAGDGGGHAPIVNAKRTPESTSGRLKGLTAFETVANQCTFLRWTLDKTLPRCSAAYTRTCSG